MKVVCTLLLLLFCTMAFCQQQQLSKEERHHLREQKARSKEQLVMQQRQELIEEKKRAGLYIDEHGSHDIRLSYGAPSFITFTDGLMKTENSRLTARSSYGVPSFSYRVFLARNIAVGLLAAFENGGGGINGYSSQLDGHFTYQSLFVAPEITVLLTKRRKKVFYTALAIGYNAMTRKLNYDTRPDKIERSHGAAANGAAGVRFPIAGALAGFLEVDFGYRGFFNCGLSLKL